MEDDEPNVRIFHSKNNGELIQDNGELKNTVCIIVAYTIQMLTVWVGRGNN